MARSYINNWRGSSSCLVSLAQTRMAQQRNVILLFDIDGTLTEVKKVMTEDTKHWLEKLKLTVPVAIVSGAESVAVDEMLRCNASKTYDHVLTQNGTFYYKKGELVSKVTMEDFLGEEKYQEFINQCLIYLANIKLPHKRGPFIDCKSNMITVTVCGKNLSQEQREAFIAFDRANKVREQFVRDMAKKFKKNELFFSLGYNQSIDVFPKGWDKSYALRHLIGQGYEIIHYFGDQPEEGGTDYEVFHHPNVIGHKVDGPESTKKQVESILYTAITTHK